MIDTEADVREYLLGRASRNAEKAAKPNVQGYILTFHAFEPDECAWERRGRSTVGHRRYGVWETVCV